MKVLLDQDNKVKKIHISNEVARNILIKTK